MGPDNRLNLDPERSLDTMAPIKEVDNDPKPQEDELNLSKLIYLITLRRQNELLAESKAGIEEVQAKGKKIASVNAASQAINAEESGALDLTKKPELIEILKQAQEAGAKINLDKMKYTPEERNRLLENLRTTTDTLNLQTQQDLQSANMLTHVFDAWKAAEVTMRTENEAKKRPMQRVNA